MNKEHREIDDLADTLSALRRGNPTPPVGAPRHIWDRLLLPPKNVRPMGLIAMQMSINPFEALLLIGLFVSALSFAVFRVPPPTSVKTLLPSYAVVVWQINLLVGTLMAIVGGTWRLNLDTGLIFYQLGWMLTGVACGVYGVAILVVNPTVGFTAAMLNLALATGCTIRVIQVQRFFRLTRRVIRAEHPGSRPGPADTAPSAPESETDWGSR